MGCAWQVVLIPGLRQEASQPRRQAWPPGAHHPVCVPCVCTLCRGNLPDPGIRPTSPVSPALQANFFTYQQYSWSPTPHFNEERYSPAPRTMKGLSGSRNPPLCSGHTCGLTPPEDCELGHLHHGPEARPPYLLSPADSCPLEHHRCSPRTSIHSDCVMLPVVLGDHVSSSTFPRMHYSSHYDSRDDCAVAHAGAKINRIPANLLDQFEKQLPLHRDGFHTLQYQRASAAAEQRSESPGRIRHLVHSVQKLFTKSHSLEGSSKGHVNGTRADGRADEHAHGHHAKHGRRSKSRERKAEGRPRGGPGSWWGSDDNLDSDSTCRASSALGRPHAESAARCYPDALPGPFGDLSLRTSKSNNDVKCSACEGLALTPDAKYMKRSSWSTLTVSQAKEAYRKSSLHLDKPPGPPELKPPLRPCHYLQVRAGQSYLQAASDGPASHGLDPSANYNSPKFRSRNQSYMRAVSTLSQASCVSQVGPSPPGVSYASYKKTPPPVPPRTTSKPLISVTAQSSTESTQDAYQDGRAQRVTAWPPDSRGLYNSTDSLDSTKAMSLALETAAAQRHASEGQGGATRTGDKAMLASKAEEFLKSQRSSIGVQDSEFPEHQPYPRSDVETATDSDTESRGLREYHSVGVQVEDEKRHGRFKRSNSVTAGVQADLELEGFPGHVATEDKGLQFGSSFQRHSEPSTPTQYGAVRTVRTQGLFSYREDYRTPVDTASLPPPDPWLEPALDAVDGGRASPCHRDGAWFLKLLHTETKRMEGWCKEMEREAEENDLVEEVLGKIRSAVGSAQLLMSQKFQQFYWLCQQNMDPSAMPRPTSQDLAGYWDMLQLSVQDVSMKFDELHQLKLSDWKVVESPERKEERKVPPPIPKKPPRGKLPITREKSLDLPDRQRQEARRRLAAAKRAASFRQSSASERADSIEIYIPEAQTRL
ncbi:hypothetical protein FD755_015071 [Muntiacus reevesi]|uniref:DLG associated protein 2 n=1 Tax=Muntiacus reevesi TaxID=9886 RepID=A0A5N3XIE1_MUNRE|nr:hypothetical protein FD755_015071 [Muntiacus reevesi]